VNNCVNPGAVYSQNPSAGAEAEQDSTVDITIATCNVPNVRGDTASDAESAITATGLTVGAVGQINTCNNPGTVHSTTPSAGVAVAPGSAVNLTLNACTDGGSPK
jgi:beta-lactam-binding protein with PASTA domain